MSDVPIIVPIAWYRRGDYPELLKLFADGAKLPATFDDWLAKAEAAEHSAKLAGRASARIIIRPRTFAEWCKERQVVPDAKARLDFIGEQAVALYRKT